MKKIMIMLVVFVGSFLVATGQEDELQKKPDNDTLAVGTSMSVYTISRNGGTETQPLAWFTHEEKRYFVEVRMNFDQVSTGAILAGKTFYFSKHFWVTPKAGILFGFNSQGFDGLSPEINFGGKFGKFSYFSMNQVAVSFHEDVPGFQYGYYQVGYAFTKWLELDYSLQCFNSADAWIDQGPQLSITIGKFNLKPWITFDSKHKVEKYIFGLGYAF